MFVACLLSLLLLPTQPSTHWTVLLDSNWDVLGPFPIHAREQHFLSPAYPLNLSQPIDYARSWPSSYADQGFLNWSLTSSSPKGHIHLSFPRIRWKSLRATEGWAALQHHAILRSTLTLYPPTAPTTRLPHLLVDLKQASYFTLRHHANLHSFVPQWYPANIYNLTHALPHVVNLPFPPSLHIPTTYDFFVSGDYEIRLFGDPLVSLSEIPVLTLSLDLQTLDINLSVIHQHSQDVVCDFWNGFAFGDSIGVGLQSLSTSWTVVHVQIIPHIAGLHFTLLNPITIAPLQTRIISLILNQTAPFFGDVIQLQISLVSNALQKVLSVSVPLIQRKLHKSARQPIKGTFLYANTIPTSFLSAPPTFLDPFNNRPPILALHGAGVDVFRDDFWINSLPNNKHSWLIVPTGRTSWGLDWHGSSANDAWSSLDALAHLSQRSVYGFPPSWNDVNTSKVIIIGHSNGGQGTWYLASRFPDKVLAAIPASSYIKSQAYVPLTLSRGGHFVDPVLRSILESSLTPDDNDLFLSNLVDVPVLAIHGGNDQNVPVWHSREALATVLACLREDHGKDHWYPSVINNQQVQTFIDEAASFSRTMSHSDSFTLTVSNPRESGSLHGWKIDQLRIPGRLARLHIHIASPSRFKVVTSNVFKFTFPVPKNQHFEIVVDESFLAFHSVAEKLQVEWIEQGKWQPSRISSILSLPPGRVQSLLSTSGPLTIVISNETQSVGLRLAHVLHTFHKLDADIVTEQTALYYLASSHWPSGNIVVVGSPISLFAKAMLAQKAVDVQVVNSTIYVGTRKFNKPGQAIIFSHPHPAENNSFILFLLSIDQSGLERVLRTFPFRTGVPVPDWLVVGSMMDTFGIGGVEGAGVWDMHWKLSESMSWFQQ